ncbi:Permease of the drug/metabolite transporter (DMT) superfamily [hydrothermal vent metagenome]|uniref:Permease of the drug/metabolite transporter (DMT) superfamily n=1 Tax=hydrothermal vent metagenome TaxID=652676 RepID=A0A3B1BA33_9ZZZZ
MPKNTQLTGFLMMAAAMVLVGSTVIVSKTIGEGMPPFTATALRFAIASPVFAGLLWFSRQKIPSLSLREWGLLIIQAASGSVAYTVLLILGLSFTSGANAGVIVGTLPVIMGLLAIMAFGERATRRLMAAIFVAGIGVFLVTLGAVSGDNSTDTLRDFIGIGLVFLAVLGEALFLLLNKKIATPIPALALSTIMSCFGFLLAIGPAYAEFSSGAYGHISRDALIGVIYYALFPTVVGFLLWYGGSAKTSAGEAALATAFMPVSALVFVAFFSHEPITLLQATGCFFVIIAILVGIGREGPKEL